jgi:hypothetical protein
MLTRKHCLVQTHLFGVWWQVKGFSRWQGPSCRDLSTHPGSVVLYVEIKKAVIGRVALARFVESKFRISSVRYELFLLSLYRKIFALVSLCIFSIMSEPAFTYIFWVILICCIWQDVEPFSQHFSLEGHLFTYVRLIFGGWRQSPDIFRLLLCGDMSPYSALHSSSKLIYVVILISAFVSTNFF